MHLLRRQHRRSRGQQAGHISCRAHEHLTDQPSRCATAGEAKRCVDEAGAHVREPLRNRRSARCSPTDRRGTGPAVLMEQVVSDGDAAGPVPAVDREDPRRPDRDVVDVRKPATRPRGVVDHHPSGRQLCQRSGSRLLACHCLSSPSPAAPASWPIRSPVGVRAGSRRRPGRGRGSGARRAGHWGRGRGRAGCGHRRRRWSPVACSGRPVVCRRPRPCRAGRPSSCGSVRTGHRGGAAAASGSAACAPAA